MSPHRLIALSCLLLASFTLHAETWEGALAKLQASVAAKEGCGLVVELERVDARRLRVRLQTPGTTFRSASFQARTEGKGSQQVLLVEGLDLDSLSAATLVEPGAGVMELAVAGSGMNPRILLKIPAEGQAPEVGLVMVGSRTK